MASAATEITITDLDASGKRNVPNGGQVTRRAATRRSSKIMGEGPENESLADEVLDELYRRDLISTIERDYYSGSSTRTEAKAAHLCDDPAVRAAKLVRLLTSPDERVNQAIRVAVTSQSTRKRITSNLFNELGTALILRAVADEPAKTDQVRRYMRHAFGKSVHRAHWQSTARDTDQIEKEALKEVRQSIADATAEEPITFPALEN